MHVATAEPYALPADGYHTGVVRHPLHSDKF